MVNLWTCRRTPWRGAVCGLAWLALALTPGCEVAEPVQAEPTPTTETAATKPASLPPDPALASSNGELKPSTTTTTTTDAQAIIPADNTNQTQLSPAELQQAIRTFADQYRETLASACDVIVVAADDDADLRRRAQQTKINGATAMYDIAVDPVPLSAVLNATVLVSLQTNFLRAHGQDVFGEHTPQLIQRAEYLQQEAFRLCSRIMTEQQSRDLLDKVNQWSTENPGVSDIWYVRLDDLPGLNSSETLAQTLDRVTDVPKRLFNKFNPFAIDQTQQSVADAQLLAERTVWLAPRLMILAQWRAEGVVYDSIANTRLPEAFDLGNRFAAVAEDLPQTLDQQRTALFADLEKNRETLESLVTTTDQFTQNATALLEAADLIAQRVITIQDTAYANAPPESPVDPNKPPGRPFDITEYTAALTELNQTLAELNTLVVNADTAASPDALESRLAVAESSVRRLILTAAVALLIVGLLIVLAAKLIPRRQPPRA